MPPPWWEAGQGLSWAFKGQPASIKDPGRMLISGAACFRDLWFLRPSLCLSWTLSEVTLQVAVTA